MMRFALLLTALLLYPPTLTANDSDTARECLTRGWADDFSVDSGWSAEPWTIQAAATAHDSKFSNTGGVFRVEQAGTRMKWTRLIEPIWVASFPFVRVRYELAGADTATAALLFSDDSTGPVTPGAMNIENPLASGAGTSIELDGGGEKLVDLRPMFRSDRIARLSIVLNAGNAPASLTLRELSFWACSPDDTAVPTTQPVGVDAWHALGSQPAPEAMEAYHWKPLPEPAGRPISRNWLNNWVAGTKLTTAYPTDTITMGGVPFSWNGGQNGAVATGIPEEEELIWTGDFQGGRLALLMWVRLFGSGHCWLGGEPPARAAVSSPHELLLRVEYADGTVHTGFPTAAQDARPIPNNRPELCIIPLDPGRRVQRITLADRMSYGQVLVLGASIHPQPLHESTTQLPAPGWTSTKSNNQPGTARSPAITVDGSSVTIQTAGMALRMNADQMLAESLLLGDGREILSKSAPLVSLVDEHAKPLALSKRMETTQQESSVKSEYQLANPNHRLSVALAIEPDGALRVDCRLLNQGPQTWKVDCILPRLDGIRVSQQASDRGYLLGTRSAMLDRKAVKVDLRHGGEWPLQLMDVFDIERGGGLGLLIEDQNFQAKRFIFQQDDSGATMEVRYGDLEIAPGQAIELPSAILLPHSGDWRAVFGRYRGWARQLRPDPARRLEGMFHCRRDYPLGGTGLLWSPTDQAYSVDRLIAESEAAFGGIDLIDISGWAYNEAVGRVGEYLNNDLGGLPVLRDAVKAAHARKVRMGLYFEGYLLDRRCELGKKALAGWQLIGKNGKGKWWPGDMELFACPGVPAWRQELVETVTEVARQTGVDAVYLDEFGISGPDKQCYDPAHGHPVPSNPPLEESRTLKMLRARLDEVSPHTAIYVEYTPADTTMSLIDAAFDYGMTLNNQPQHPTGLPLHRFAFPEVRFVEMIGFGIRPVPIGPDDLHRCLFHGMSLWLKGRADAWFSAAFRRDSRAMYRVLSEHAATFHSDNCDPLIPTLIPGLYANSFQSQTEQIITLYNANYRSVDGPLIAAKITGEVSGVLDLLGERPAEHTLNGTTVTVHGHVEPRSAAAFRIAR